MGAIVPDNAVVCSTIFHFWRDYMKEFTDKVVAITGSASGIGRGLAERCAKENMKIVLADNLHLDIPSLFPRCTPELKLVPHIRIRAGYGVCFRIGLPGILSAISHHHNCVIDILQR